MSENFIDAVSLVGLASSVSYLQIEKKAFAVHLSHMTHEELAEQYVLLNRLKESLGDYCCEFFFADCLDWFDNAMRREMVSRFVRMYVPSEYANSIE